MSPHRDWNRRASLRELDDQRLAEHFSAQNDTTIGTAPLGGPVRIVGEVREIRVVPAGDDPRFEAHLADGSGTLVARWSNEARPPGIRPGAQVRLHGEIEVDERTLTMREPVVDEAWAAQGVS